MILPQLLAWLARLQQSGEAESLTDEVFPSDSATWLMASLLGHPGIACRYSSLPFCLLPVSIWWRELLCAFLESLPTISAQYFARVVSFTSPSVLHPPGPLNFLSLWQALQYIALQAVNFLSCSAECCWPMNTALSLQMCDLKWRNRNDK